MTSGSLSRTSRGMRNKPRARERAGTAQGPPTHRSKRISRRNVPVIDYANEDTSNSESDDEPVTRSRRATYADISDSDESEDSDETDGSDEEEDAQPEKLEKQLVKEGLYANQKRKGKPKQAGAFPLPQGAGLEILDSEHDFKLPYNIYCPKYPMSQVINWKPMRRNHWMGRTQSYLEQHRDMFPLCTCPVGNCDEDCLNRLSQIECDPSCCPSGPMDCGNRALQQMALMPTPPHMLGLGLNSQHNTKSDSLSPPSSSGSASSTHSTSLQRGVLYGRGYEIFETSFKGYGLRATRAYGPHELILEYTGEVISVQQMEDRLANEYKNLQNYYCLSLGNSLVIDSGKRGSEARFVNHSCNPNCEMEKWYVKGLPRVGLYVGEEPIPAGTEFTYDYNFDIFGGAIAQICHCSSDKCRGVIGKRTDTPTSRSASSASPSPPPGQRPPIKLKLSLVGMGSGHKDRGRKTGVRRSLAKHRKVPRSDEFLDGARRRLKARAKAERVLEKVATDRSNLLDSNGIPVIPENVSYTRRYTRSLGPSPVKIDYMKLDPILTKGRKKHDLMPAKPDTSSNAKTPTPSALESSQRRKKLARSTFVYVPVDGTELDPEEKFMREIQEAVEEELNNGGNRPRQRRLRSSIAEKPQLSRREQKVESPDLESQSPAPAVHHTRRSTRTRRVKAKPQPRKKRTLRARSSEVEDISTDPEIHFSEHQSRSSSFGTRTEVDAIDTTPKRRSLRPRSNISSMYESNGESDSDLEPETVAEEYISPPPEQVPSAVPAAPPVRTAIPIPVAPPVSPPIQVLPSDTFTDSSPIPVSSSPLSARSNKRKNPVPPPLIVNSIYVRPSAKRRSRYRGSVYSEHNLHLKDEMLARLTLYRTPEFVAATTPVLSDIPQPVQPITKKLTPAEKRQAKLAMAMAAPRSRRQMYNAGFAKPMTPGPSPMFAPTPPIIHPMVQPVAPVLPQNTVPSSAPATNTGIVRASAPAPLSELRPRDTKSTANPDTTPAAPNSNAPNNTVPPAAPATPQSDRQRTLPQASTGPVPAQPQWGVQVPMPPQSASPGGVPPAVGAGPGMPVPMMMPLYGWGAQPQGSFMAGAPGQPKMVMMPMAPPFPMAVPSMNGFMPAPGMPAGTPFPGPAPVSQTRPNASAPANTSPQSQPMTYPSVLRPR